jgi:hypothetical protein
MIEFIRLSLAGFSSRGLHSLKQDGQGIDKGPSHRDWHSSGYPRMRYPRLRLTQSIPNQNLKKISFIFQGYLSLIWNDI